MNPVQKAQDILSNPQSQLGKILQRAKQIKQLDTIVKKELSSALAAHCYVCNLKNGRLVLLADSAAFALRLKQQFPQLLETLRQMQGFQGLSGIDCKVSPKLAE